MKCDDCNSGNYHYSSKFHEYCCDHCGNHISNDDYETLLMKDEKNEYQLLQEAFWIQLFNETQHGDREHREWLRDKYIEMEKKKSGIELDKKLFTIKEK